MQKTITLCGRHVEMIYCSATENGYEDLSGKSIQVFVPTYGKDADGNDIIVAPAEAKIGDYVTLAIAGIMAAYAQKEQDAPVGPKDILFKINGKERNEMITSIIELRNKWYDIPAVVKEMIKADASGSNDGKKGDKGKN